ncbi:MAG: nucleotide exchange factor GrpE [Candidatus Niyogibacteria bacterium CG10_big_fil_rev_8_21_14_0_10_42_19]|uniref:Protein GrpE n=1 Tax=Candidatus Niyogibacteria bacterium CG10_big_fil_rev_8_21_14_0_10_42_19 TaxID=1974725 RepID=A0A2H0TG59_9BACT|nr:MAG: nucleotide exchange factor GrpE [Candidatus Niyogibacteria bacterium CG10_big_fil_rev_8_21_14_0_10_42_19]
MDTNNNEEIEFVEEEGISDAEKKIKKIKKELEVCRKEKDEYLSGWQRAKADYINSKKDEDRLKEHLVKFAEENIIKDILGVVDGFEMARSSDKAGEWTEGINNIYKEFIKVLSSYGVEEINDTPKEFDPAVHEAIEQIEANKEDDNRVIQVLQKGYKMRGKILRPAKVRVGIYNNKVENN